MKGEETPHEPLPESRFIGNDERCPHPEFWHSTDGDSTELEVSEMIAGLVRGLQPRVVVETGAAFGQTTKMIAEAMRVNGHGMLVAYENDEERYQALARLCHVPGSELCTQRVVLCRHSLKGELGDAPLDFSFFDSWPELRVPEYHHFRRWMRPGTIVAFHDTRPGAGAHRIAAGVSLREQLESLEDVKLLDMPTPRGLTLGQVL